MARQREIIMIIGEGGLHAYFESQGGSLSQAITHSKQSITERNRSGRNYTYSEIGNMIEQLSLTQAKMFTQINQ